MPRVLTVDDSRAIRQIVAKQLVPLGIDIDEAEHGEDGLARLEETQFDLVLLDVTMPVMDGPTMLQKMRETGNKTPVIMLTSESKRSIVANAMKLGIDDYILKPFKPEELRGKVAKLLNFSGGEAAPAQEECVAAQNIEPPRRAMVMPDTQTPRQFIDILLIDDMENVHKKFRSLLPQHVTVTWCASAQTALQSCRERIFRVVVIDMAIPDVNSTSLMNQLRLLQGQANMLALYLRSTEDPAGEARSQGFDDYLVKPFAPESMEDFLGRYFDKQELLTTEENVLSAAEQKKNDQPEKYFTRLGDLVRSALAKLADASFDEVILDLNKLPQRADMAPRFVLTIDSESKKMGMELRVVGPPELSKILASFTDTAKIPLFDSVDQARKGAA